MVEYREVSLEELEREFEEKRKKAATIKVNGVHEDVMLDVIDVGISKTGNIVELYTVGDVYTYPFDEKAREILEMVKQGRIVRVKGTRVVGYKRLITIDEVVETKTVKLKPGHLIDGSLDRFGSMYRIVNNSGERYYIQDGTVNVEKIGRLFDSGVNDVRVIAATVTVRKGTRGDVKVIRGLYIVKPKLEEIPVKQVEERPEDIEKLVKEAGGERGEQPKEPEEIQI